MLRKPKEFFRLIFSIIFLMGSITNLFILMNNPGLYSTFADLSLVEVYRTVWYDVVLSNLNIIIFTVAIFEIVLAILIASKGRAVQSGLILAAIFMLILVPFWWDGGAITNIIFALILLRLARYQYSVSLTHWFLKKTD